VYKIEFYRLDVENEQFVFLGECESFTDLYYDNVLNDVGSCSFNISIYDHYASSVYLRRMSTIVVIKKNNTCVWFGPIADVIGSYSNIDGHVNVTAYSYLYFFKFRNTAKSKIYSQIEQCEIAWDLINDSQNQTNGTLLVTEGLNPTSNKRDRTYETYTISEALINLTNIIDGFDFSFEPVFDADNRLSSVLFNSYYPMKGTDRSDLGKLEIGINISAITFDTISSLYNAITVEGAGTGVPIIYEDEDEDFQKAYSRIEGYEKASDISEYDSLEKHGDKLLSERVEGYKITLDVMPNSNIINSGLAIGDTVVCNLEVGNYLSLKDRKIRIKSMPISVDEQGIDELSLIAEIYG
jgi:hypothetical protein